jgi:hypothetical protein
VSGIEAMGCAAETCASSIDFTIAIKVMSLSPSLSYRQTALRDLADGAHLSGRP